MNRLGRAERAKILSLLCEGVGINAACRISGASKMTVLKLLADAGEACAGYHDTHVRGLNSKRVECDEIWSFVYAKEKNVSRALSAPDNAGDVWTWTAIDADSKLMISYLVANRDADSAWAFAADLKSRLDTNVQLTTDGLRLYIEAVSETFGSQADYAQLVKMYGKAGEVTQSRYSPAQCTGISKKVISGDPDMSKVSTSYVERSNLTIRMQNRRFTRLTNGFSKKIENHLHAFSLFVMHYNFCKVHKTLRVTPAMESGLTDHIWSHEEIIDLLADRDTPKKRGPYKKKGLLAI